jgi:uncharacterized membrane protein required for colicin V production
MSVNLYDVIIVVLILFFAYNGFKKGLVMTVLRFVSLIVAFIIGRTLSPRITRYITDTSYFQSLNEMIKGRLVDLQAAGSENFIQSLQSSPNGEGQGIIARILAKQLEDGKMIDTNNVVDFLSLSLTNMVLNIASFILVFFIALAILNVLLLLVKGVVSLPGLKQLDRGGGFIFGLLQGIFIAYILIMIFAVFNFGGLSGEFENTMIVKWFVQYIPVG